MDWESVMPSPVFQTWIIFSEKFPACHHSYWNIDTRPRHVPVIFLLMPLKMLIYFSVFLFDTPFLCTLKKHICCFGHDSCISSCSRGYRQPCAFLLRNKTSEMFFWCTLLRGQVEFLIKTRGILHAQNDVNRCATHLAGRIWTGTFLSQVNIVIPASRVDFFVGSMLLCISKWFKQRAGREVDSVVRCSPAT